MLRLAKPTGEAAKVLKKLGVQTKDSRGNFRDAIDIIGDFETGLKGMGTQQRTAALATVFGTRTITGMSLLLKKGSAGLRQYRQDLINSGGAAAKMAAAMRESLMNQLKVLGSTLTEKGFQIVEVFETQGGGAIKNLTAWVKNFDVGPIVDLLNVTISFFKFIASNWKILLAMAGAIKAVSISIGIASIAAKIFGFTLMATPMGWMIGIVAALSAGLILLATNWDSVTESLKEFWGWIKKIGASALGGALRLIGVDTDIGKEKKRSPTTFSLNRPDPSAQRSPFFSNRPNANTQRSPFFSNRPNANTQRSPLASLGGAELPVSSNPMAGLLDINFNNKPEDVNVVSKGLPKGVNVSIPPTESS